MNIADASVITIPQDKSYVFGSEKHPDVQYVDSYIIRTEYLDYVYSTKSQKSCVLYMSAFFSLSRSGRLSNSSCRPKKSASLIVLPSDDLQLGSYITYST